MPRTERIDIADIYYHVINRANARMTLFKTDRDYKLFEKTLMDADEKIPIKIVAYCVMPNHFHLLLMPHHNGDVGRFMHALTMTHTQRWHAMHHTTGSGHIYQGRYKSFMVESDTYLITVMRYIERNPLRARLVKKAEDWKWSSLWRRVSGTSQQKKLLGDPPIGLPKDYVKFLNEPQTPQELEALRRSVNRGSPFGGDDWHTRIIAKFKMESTIRGRGRPKKGS